MRLGYLTLLSGLLISAVAIFYSVAGLASIFSAAMIPIIVMGVSLELAKLVVTVWLKQNWDKAPFALKTYLTIAVVVLMMITSMGIFGYLSKAHSDQALVSGDISARLSVYDQKIQTAKDNIDADRKALQQMDAVVDQTMGRTTTAAGASTAVSIRKSQKNERTRVAQDIETQQKAISDLMETSAPIRSQSRKVEAEVGPIKYIAQLIYGPNPNENILEQAVSWVIILIVIVFDPLAITLLLASQYSFAQAAEERRESDEEEFDEDDFKKKFFDLKGTVDPAIDLEYGGANEGLPEVPSDAVMEMYLGPDPTDRHIQSEIDAFDESEEDLFIPSSAYDEDLTALLNPVAETEWLAEIIHNEDLVTKSKPEVPMIEEDTAEHMESIEEAVHTPEVKITHTENSMIIEDSAGTQEIVTAEPRTYVQNEEQRESNKWTEILKPISEGEYLETARRRKSTDSE